MSKLETLRERVAKATESVEKKRATIVRHEKQLEKKVLVLTRKGLEVDLNNLSVLKWDADNNKPTDESWEVYAVESKLRDIKGATQKLKEAEVILENWKNKLLAEEEKERFLNDDAPQVIKDFLEKWKKDAFEWYVRRYDAYLKFCDKLKEEEENAYQELGIEKNRMPTREQGKALKGMNLDWRSIEQRKAFFAGPIVLRMKTYRKEEERLEYLEKTLEEEKRNKMLDLINRISDVVGKITDASSLRITAGNLNGIIIGEKARAKVETISAGGWNIQCWHYRTLVHKI